MTAREDETPSSGEKKKPAAGKGLVALGQEILASAKFITDPGGTTFRFSGTLWAEITDYQLNALALEADGPKRSIISRRREIVAYIKTATVVHEAISWGRVKDHEVACLNGVVDITNGRLRPHDPEDKLDKVLPWDWHPGAECPEWLGALARLFPDDDGEIAAIQEGFGYIVTPHARYKKAVVLFGGKDSGKSMVAANAQALVGKKNVCTLPLDKMGDPVMRDVIVGKMLNVLTELNPEQMNADDGFKQLVSTEEPVLINPKYKPPFLYVPTAKHLFAANPPLPRGLYKEEAVLGRLHIIPFQHRLAPEEQDPELAARIAATEMHGVLLWAIQGAARLFAQKGRFSHIAAAEKTMAEIDREANPIIQFIEERTEGDITNAIPLVRLADAFNRWQRGSRKVTTKGIGKMCRDAGAAVKLVRAAAPPGQKRRGNGVMSLIGCRLVRDLTPDNFTVPEDAAITEGEVEGRVESVSEEPF